MNVEKGDKWRCKKDVIMHPTGKTAFIKNRIYTAEYDERLTNEQGNVDHVVTKEEGFLDEYFQPYDCPRAISVPTNERDTRLYTFPNVVKVAELGAIAGKVGTKESDGKLDYEIDFEFITQMAERMAVNKGKYEPYNWQRIQDLEKLKQALFRHVMKVMNGEYDDEGRDFGHLEAIALNVMFLNYQLKNK